MSAIVTLTTDFGLRDPYVAAMKAVILGITRAVHLIDVTHEVAPHDVMEAALALEAAVPVFPPRTVHLAVVDPGVGTTRRAIVLESDRQIFVGPDNGLFTPFIARGRWRAFELTVEDYRRSTVSRTFHGRDVFAPAAGHLARGLPASRLGPPVTDPITLRWPGSTRRAGTVEGEVIHVDRFGNLVTSIDARALGAFTGRARVRVARRAVPLVGTYGDLASGELGAMIGSGNRLEVAQRDGSAAARLGAHRGMPVRVSPAGSRG
jgi:S-adenosyl-L-methionine hydrolase (adenosine-forming)